MIILGLTPNGNYIHEVQERDFIIYKVCKVYLYVKSIVRNGPLRKVALN